MGEKEIDLVCRREIYQHQAKHVFDYHGVKVYFCSEECLKAFEHDPTTYIENLERSQAGWQ